MKKNEEKILNYLSELMTEDERKFFEHELSLSEELRDDFENIKHSLNDLNVTNKIEVNEIYFANLLPRLRNKLDVKKKFWQLRNLSYIVPTAAAAVVVFMFIFNSQGNYKMDYKEVANEVVNNISDNEVSDKYLTELETDPANTIISENNSELSVQIPFEIELNNETISKLFDNSETDNYTTLGKLSDNDLEKIYNRIKSKNSK
jgi:hypothetical protein